MISILLLTFLNACVTDEGRWPEADAGTGNIIIKVTPALPATIYLNYRNTGLTAPDHALNSIPVGEHIIHLRYPNYRSEPDSFVVAAEDGKSTEVAFSLLTTSSGHLLIKSRPFAAIFLNRILLGYADYTGRYQENSLPVGKYLLQVRKNAFEEILQDIEIKSGLTSEVTTLLAPAGVVPLIEHFANTSCIPCPATDEVLEAVLRDFGVSRCISLGYHSNFPGASDPMYLAAPSENTNRMNYYAITAVPYVLFNGKKINYYANASRLNDTLRQKIPKERNRSSVVSIQIQPDWSADFNVLTGAIRLEAIEPLSANVRLRVACVERSVDFSEAPGANGMKHFFDILRAFYPDPDGMPVQMTQGLSQSFSYQFNRRPEWGYDLVVIAFLQDDSSREILQSAWTLYP